MEIGQGKAEADRATVLSADTRTELVERIQSLEEAYRQGIPGEVIKAITANPRHARRVVDAYVILSLRDNPGLLTVYADAQRRSTGMWIGAALTGAAVTGAVGLLLTGAPAAIGLALLSIGAACAGCTFAVITGKSISAADFVKLIQAVRTTIGRRP